MPSTENIKKLLQEVKTSNNSRHEWSENEKVGAKNNIYLMHYKSPHYTDLSKYYQ